MLPLDLPLEGKVHHGLMVHTATPGVSLLYFDDCPNWRVADSRLREALARVGGDPDAISYQQVTTVEEAAALGFRGSPTILVDGKDPFAEADAPTGLACRLYRRVSGRDPVPTVEELQALLTVDG